MAAGFYLWCLVIDMEMIPIFHSDDESDSDIGTIYSTILTRRERSIANRPYFFDKYDETSFRVRFRLSKTVAWQVLEYLRPRIQRKVTGSNAVLPEQMFLLTLRYYATGCMQRMNGDVFGVSQPTVSRIIASVTHHLAMLREQFIYMPKSAQELEDTRSKFLALAKFPGVIAAMDCTHVRISSPGGEDAEIYRNRKGFFSINVQTLCDSDLKILDVVARWPGSTHDATIFRNSRICHRLESREFVNGLVIADSGYQNTNFVITPLQRITNDAENLFNEALIRTRNCVERSYGVWKRRFPVLSLGVRIKMKKVQALIVATAVLHNICCINNEKDAPHLNADLRRAVDQVLNVPHNRSAVGGNMNSTRRNLIDTYFTTLS